MTDDELEKRLDRLGSESGPGVDPAFANRLDTDLRVLATEREDLSTARPWWQPVILASVVLMCIVAGVVALIDQEPTTEVVMTAADDTVLVLPDGTEATGAEGTELAEGTRIVVGPDGSAVVDGVVLPAGSEAVVVDGRVEIVEQPVDGDAGEGDGAGDAPASPGPDESVPTTAPERTTTTGRATTTTAAVRSSTSSSAADRSTSTASTEPSPPTTTVTSSTDGVSSTTSAPQPTVELAVTAEGDTRIRLTWSGSDLGDVAGWRVLATSGDRTAVVLVIRDGAASDVTLERLDGEVGYRVVAVTAGGRVVAESNLVVI